MVVTVVAEPTDNDAEVAGDQAPQPAGGRRRLLRRLLALPSTVLVPVALVAGFGLAAMGALGIQQLTGPDPAVQREAVLEYAAGIEQVARSAASVIEFEMKPALSDIASGEGLPAGEQLTRGWAEDLTSLQEGLVGKQPPGGSEDAHQRFLDALASYADTARAIGRAAAAEDHERREQLLDEAAEQGRASDQIWNDARDRLEAFLREHDLDMQVG